MSKYFQTTSKFVNQGQLPFQPHHTAALSMVPLFFHITFVPSDTLYRKNLMVNILSLGFKLGPLRRGLSLVNPTIKCE